VGLTLLDSSAAIAYIDRDDALHHAAASEIEATLRGGSALAISAISWTELLHGAFIGHHDEEGFRRFVTDFGIAILPVDELVAERAAELQADFARSAPRAARRRLRTPDALILATADVDPEIDAVIAGDDQWPKVLGVHARIELLEG
jgi:predicted nucleic acid-binding protein